MRLVLQFKSYFDILNEKFIKSNDKTRVRISNTLRYNNAMRTFETKPDQYTFNPSDYKDKLLSNDMKTNNTLSFAII